MYVVGGSSGREAGDSIVRGAGRQGREDRRNEYRRNERDGTMGRGGHHLFARPSRRVTGPWLSECEGPEPTEGPFRVGKDARTVVWC